MQSEKFEVGIYLPNGDFVSNSGDGHVKNAQRICRKYSELAQLLNSTREDEDDFVLQCGFAISASYSGNYCFKVAKNNPFPEITKITEAYFESDVKIYDCWEINPEYLEKVKEIPEITLKRSFRNVKESISDDTISLYDSKGGFLNLFEKTGFILNGYFYSNSKRGHEETARNIIFSNGWSKEWYSKKDSAQDFIVFYKKAIQIGSGIQNRIIVANSKFYTERKIQHISVLYRLNEYKIFLFDI